MDTAEAIIKYHLRNYGIKSTIEEISDEECVVLLDNLMEIDLQIQFFYKPKKKKDNFLGRVLIQREDGKELILRGCKSDIAGVVVAACVGYIWDLCAGLNEICESLKTSNFNRKKELAS